jgi:hypothetical protein
MKTHITLDSKRLYKTTEIKEEKLLTTFVTPLEKNSSYLLVRLLIQKINLTAIIAVRLRRSSY